MRAITTRLSDTMQKPQIESVGIIGIGKMGTGYADNLEKAGLLRAVYDVNSSALEQFNNSKVYVAKSPKDMVENADIDLALISIPVYPYDATDDVLFGENGIAQAMKKDAIIAECGNSDPRDSMYAAARALEEFGIDLLDVGVSGGPSRAKDKSVAIWVGGKKEAYDLCLPVFNAMGNPEEIAYMGPSGSGHYVKMLHNLLEQTYMEGIAEVANLAKTNRLDPKYVLKTISGGLVNSSLLNLFLSIPDEKIINRDTEVGGGDYPRIALGAVNEGEKPEPIPATALAYHERRISRFHGTERTQAIEEAKTSIGKELDKFNDEEKFAYALKTLGALRTAFGGHK